MISTRNTITNLSIMTNITRICYLERKIYIYLNMIFFIYIFV